MNKSIAFVALLAVTVTAPLGCMHHSFMHADSVSYEGVSLQPNEVWISGHKLWVRATVINTGTQPIQVDRDAVLARLPSGPVVGRAMGVTTVHAPYVILGGMSHPVYVEFHESGFDWDHVQQATIDFTGAITREGQPLPLQLTVMR